MPDRLFPLLLLLTLLDLAFVQATGVVSGAGLLPLWLLALAAPWLRRLQRRPGCRALWNVVVLLVFALLVHHATTTGLLYMLEDGLLLAVLCQVHLLNNVGERQRPDLVFFNSFLVAFVTSFFAPDLTWSFLFVAHAFVFVPALQVNVFARRGGPVAPDLLRTLLRDSARRTCTIGAVTALVFVALPRDFARPGWLGDTMLAPTLQAGIADQIRLDNELPMRLGDDVVLRLEPSSGDPEDVPTHWRSIAFSSFDGSAWSPQDAGRPAARTATDPAWTADRSGGYARALPPSDGTIRVRLHDRDGRRLPVPLLAQGLRITSDEDLLFDPKPYGVLGVVRRNGSAAAIDYTVRMGAAAGSVRPSAFVRHQMIELPPNGVPTIVGSLAERLRSQLPVDASDAAVAQACCDWLQQHRRYELPGAPGFARNLGEFLIGTAAGHCEYFATALALLLRVQAIPCRLVGGYLAHERDAATTAVLARAKHAHAWVELLREDGTWMTLDPTPPASVMAGPLAAKSWWQASGDQLAELWSQIVGFDGARRAAWLQTIAGAPAAAWRASAAHPLATFLLLASGGWLVYRRVRRRQSTPAVEDLERAMRAAGLSLLDGETPRELLARAATTGLPAARLATLRAATWHHESLRYGRCDGGTPR